MTPENVLRVVSTLNADVQVKYSPWTDSFYVDADVEISDGHILSGIVEHRPTIEQAVIAYWNRLTEVDVPDKLVVNAMRPGRTEYRWNGSVFHKIG